MAILTDVKARNLSPEDRPISDGSVAGLRLEAGKVKGQGKWIFRYVSPVTGKRRDMGLGAYPDVSIASARAAASDARDVLRAGDDPIENRKAVRASIRAEATAVTFEDAARDVHRDLQQGWKNAKHIAQWIDTLEALMFPKIGKRKVKDLKARDFADALRPIWTDKPETASRVKQRCHAVMEWCIAQEMVDANPVGSVVRLLPKQAGKRERVNHQPAMPWRDLPKFVKEVLHIGPVSLSKAMLEFLILTAARSGEVRAMTWDEVDLDNAVWTVPAARMKAKVAHRVPLSARTVQILRHQKRLTGQGSLVFPSVRGKVPTDMILTKFLRDKQAPSSDPGRTATAHGFRSSFRDWASENGYPRDLAERALAHTIRNSTEAAYHRTDLLDQRKVMMEAWANHVCGVTGHAANVVSIRG